MSSQPIYTTWPLKFGLDPKPDGLLLPGSDVEQMEAKEDFVARWHNANLDV